MTNSELVTWQGEFVLNKRHLHTEISLFSHYLSVGKRGEKRNKGCDCKLNYKIALLKEKTMGNLHSNFKLQALPLKNSHKVTSVYKFSLKSSKGTEHFTE
jgi:hypothetical protein